MEKDKLKRLLKFKNLSFQAFESPAVEMWGSTKDRKREVIMHTDYQRGLLFLEVLHHIVYPIVLKVVEEYQKKIEIKIMMYLTIVAESTLAQMSTKWVWEVVLLANNLSL